MERRELVLEILNVLNLEEGHAGEDTLLSDIEFDSIAKLGVISVIDTFMDKIVDAGLLSECLTIGNLADMAFNPS